jgi:hypothetical protein
MKSLEERNSIQLRSQFVPEISEAPIDDKELMKLGRK